MDDFIFRNSPSTIKEVVLGTKALRKTLNFLSTNTFSSSTLLVGAKGVGKFTIATFLIERSKGIAISPDCDLLNDVEERIILSINSQRRNYVESKHHRIACDVDKLTHDAQLSLAQRIEQETLFRENKKTVLTTVDLRKTSPDIISLCQVVQIPNPPQKCWINHVATILENEGFDRLSDNQYLSIIRQGRGTAKGIMRELFYLCEKSK